MYYFANGSWYGGTPTPRSCGCFRRATPMAVPSPPPTLACVCSSTSPCLAQRSATTTCRACCRRSCCWWCGWTRVGAPFHWSLSDVASMSVAATPAGNYWLMRSHSGEGGALGSLGPGINQSSVVPNFYDHGATTRLRGSRRLKGHCMSSSASIFLFARSRGTH